MDQLPIPQNFQGLIQQADQLMAEAKTAMKVLSGVSIPGLEGVLNGILTNALTPVFALLGQFRTYIPVSVPNLPGVGGIGGIGNLSIPNVGLGDLNNNITNTIGIKGL